ncbi:hypothetical protein A3Q24_07785 [Lactobacillus johnsonii]|uniref:Glycosyltransferase 2-like domain-containing protein n=1 Tax=Lactobacillus johnsonii TaxID=33959 RepID=A0A267M6J8_LACJH|nr:glycosyltransferase [Lactobacillus johnsonii]PAB54425.1 hypothetical protein A3Q24_07785 [Lactobacillus johnsonii]
MNLKTKVSVILPIYNADKYLEKCVNTIINQTYSNLQIILVDDGSTDNSWDICQSLKTKDKRISIMTQNNSGVSVARNSGMDMADGDWIMFVDPDDYLDKRAIEILLANANSQTDIAICSCYGVDENAMSKKRAHFFEDNQTFNKNKSDLYLQLLNSSYKQTGSVFTAIGVPWGKLYRFSFLKKYSLRFDPSLRRMQDNIFNMYAFYFARNINYIDKSLYFYRLDHITDYAKRHRKDFPNIFKPIAVARTKGIYDLKLYKNYKIYDFYLQELAGIFFGVVNSLMITSNDFSNEVNHLKVNSVFKELFKNKKYKRITNKKIRLKLFIIDNNLYKLYSLAYNLWKK